MVNLLKYCCLFLFAASVPVMGYADEPVKTDMDGMECPEGKVFDEELGACVSPEDLEKSKDSGGGAQEESGGGM